MILRLAADRSPILLAAALAVLLVLFFATQPVVVVGVTLAAVAVIALALFNRMLALFAVAAAAISPELSIAGVSTHLRIEAIIMVLFAAVWMLRVVVSGQRRTSPLDPLVVVYVLAGFMSVLWGLYLGTVHLTLVDRQLSAPLALLQRLEFAFLFFVVIDTLETAGQVRTFTYVMMAALAAVSAYSASQYLAGQSAIAVATAGAPVHEAGWASLLNVAFALSLLPAASRPGKVLLVVLLAFSLAVLPLTLGRTFVVSTMFVMAYIGMTQRRQRWVLLCLPLPLLSWLVYPAMFADRVLTLQPLLSVNPTGAQTAGASLYSRIIAPVSYTALSLGYSPLLGFGRAAQPLGAMDTEYATQLFYPGLIGFGLFIALAARMFRMALEIVREARAPLDAPLANAYLSILIAVALFSTLSASLSPSRAGAFIFIVAGMLAALHRSRIRPERRPA